MSYYTMPILGQGPKYELLLLEGGPNPGCTAMPSKPMTEAIQVS